MLSNSMFILRQQYLIDWSIVAQREEIIQPPTHCKYIGLGFKVWDIFQVYILPSSAALIASEKSKPMPFHVIMEVAWPWQLWRYSCKIGTSSELWLNDLTKSSDHPGPRIPGPPSQYTISHKTPVVTAFQIICFSDIREIQVAYMLG